MMVLVFGRPESEFFSSFVKIQKFLLLQFELFQYRSLRLQLTRIPLEQMCVGFGASNLLAQVLIGKSLKSSGGSGQELNGGGGERPTAGGLLKFFFEKEIQGFLN